MNYLAAATGLWADGDGTVRAVGLRWRAWLRSAGGSAAEIGERAGLDPLAPDAVGREPPGVVVAGRDSPARAQGPRRTGPSAGASALPRPLDIGRSPVRGTDGKGCRRRE